MRLFILAHLLYNNDSLKELRILRGAPAPDTPAKENCGRKSALIEHDARHLKLESSATEKPQQAAILHGSPAKSGQGLEGRPQARLNLPLLPPLFPIGTSISSAANAHVPPLGVQRNSPGACPSPFGDGLLTLSSDFTSSNFQQKMCQIPSAAHSPSALHSQALVRISQTSSCSKHTFDWSWLKGDSHLHAKSHGFY
ncbi:hypothetical protein AOLI_G00279090 [Acnodon oligacanthus]